MEGEFHVDIITGRKSCHHDCADKTMHFAYHVDLMLSANEHALEQQTLSSHTRCVIENLERHVNEREAVLEEQKLIRQLTFMDCQVNYEPLTDNEIEEYHQQADDSDQLFIKEHLVHDLCLSRAIAEIEAAKQLAQNRRSETFFFLHPQLAEDFFKLQQLSECEVLPESFPLLRSVGSLRYKREMVAQAYRVLNLEVEDHQTGSGSSETPVVHSKWL